MAEVQLAHIRLGLRSRGASTKLRLRWDRAPLTCAAVVPMLPVEEQVYHAKYANNEIYNLVPMPEPAPPQEWACMSNPCVQIHSIHPPAFQSELL